MLKVAVKILGVLLSMCGGCPPSAVVHSNFPRLMDALNMILRLFMVAAYSATHLFSPGSISELKSNTYKVVLILMRLVSVVHYVFTLLLSPALGRCLAKTTHLRLKSAWCLIPCLMYICVIVTYAFIWRNPFESLHEFPVIFIYMSLNTFNFVCTFYTVILKIALHEHQEINRLLEKPIKNPIEREEVFARVALKRTQINKLLAMVDEGVGPMVAATVFALSIRVAFSLFTNFSMVMEMFSSKMPAATTLLLVFPRTILDSCTLAFLANAGQNLKNEASKGRHELGRLITESATMPPPIVHQIRKCYQVFAKDKIVLSAWGLFNVDHSMILMIVSIIFALLLIQIQFLVSEIVST